MGGRLISHEVMGKVVEAGLQDGHRRVTAIDCRPLVLWRLFSLFWFPPGKEWLNIL